MGKISPPASANGGSSSLPTGGSAGDILRKSSSTDGDAAWASVDTTVNLDDLSDVSAGSPSSGQALVWSGTAWIPSTSKVLLDTDRVSAFKPSDYGKKFSSYDPGFIASGKALSSGLVLVTRLNTPGPAQAITNLFVALTAAASTVTAAGAWAYIWDASGTLLATSTDQSTPWSTAGNLADTLMDALAVPMSFNTPANSWVWVGLHVPSATGYPSFGRYGAEGNGTVNIGLTTSQLRVTALTSQSAKLTGALTVPLSANAAGGSWVWLALA
jgi:hypothetical protein